LSTVPPVLSLVCSACSALFLSLISASFLSLSAASFFDASLPAAEVAVDEVGAQRAAAAELTAEAGRELVRVRRLQRVADLHLDAGVLAVGHQRTGHGELRLVDGVAVADHLVEPAVLALGVPVGLDHDGLRTDAGE